MTAAMSAPTSRSRQRTRRAVASRKPSQNTPTFSTSETSTAPTVAPTPVSRCPAPPARPDRNVVTMNPMATVSSSASDQTCDMGKPGRLGRGIPQTSQSAFCIALATPRAPSSRKTAPMMSGRPVPGIDPSWVLICWPMTGYWARAEFVRVFCSSGSFLSTMSRTVASTSSSGKIAAKP